MEDEQHLHFFRVLSMIDSVPRRLAGEGDMNRVFMLAPADWYELHPEYSSNVSSMNMTVILASG